MNPQQPTTFSERLRAMSPRKRQLLEMRLTELEGRSAGIRRLPERGSFPLSFAQERLWFLHQLEPASPVYNLFSAYRLRGPLHLPVLARALNEIVRRHEILRTTFAAPDGEPVQVVHDGARLELPVVDAARLEAGGVEELLRRLGGEIGRQPFDLARGPLTRIVLLRRGPEDHRLVLVMHHIISDGWSVGILVRDLAALYQAFAEWRPSPLPALAIQYGDFAHWQRQWLRGEVLEEQLAFWRRQLGGAPPVLELATDRPRPAVQTYRGIERSRRLSRRRVAALRTLGRDQGATLYMTLLALFQILLARRSGQTDLSVGSPVAGRGRVETEPLIGFFVNTLVLRGDLSGDPTFRQLLAQARKRLLDAQAHQDLPFAQLVQDLEPERSLSYSPLFQMLFVLQNVPREHQHLGSTGLKLGPFDMSTRTAKFDLSLEVIPTGEELLAVLEISTDLYDPTTAERLLGELVVLIDGTHADPGRHISELPMLSPSESHQLAVEWNDRAEPTSAGGWLHELVADQARRTPAAPALVRGRETLTYGELERRANRLAWDLRRRGVGPETRVGVATSRSPAMVAGLLAILKAGGAYVPLDPSYPRERLRAICEDAGLTGVLTESYLMERLPLGEAWTLCLDEEARRPAGEDGHDPPPLAGERNLAYVIYTSGSTGRPKGVAIEHRSATALCRWAWEVFPAAELDGVLAASSICFDLSIFEIFVPLSRGGRVVLAEDALELPELPAASGVRLVNTVPSAIAELVSAGGVPDSVRTVNLAGEALRRSLVDDVYRGCPGVERVLNLYGPSEDTTYSTFALIARNAETPPAIGRPVAGGRAWVLDPGLAPVAIGGVGELCLGGVGLARGYLDRPARTAEGFVPAPPRGEPGARLYRTGDLARWRPEGELEFLGRTDHQVKVRGFRIEPGEVEIALARHAGVREAVVTAVEETAGGRRLVACAVPAGPALPAVEELRAFLLRSLPAHMVPAVFVPMTALPLLPNGKIDRAAVSRRALSGERPELSRAYVAPRTPAEEVVAASWSEELGIERIGAQDNFFALGGHSLVATRLVHRLRQAFRVELPLRTLFEGPTVAAMAHAIARLEHSGAGPEPALPPIVPDLAARHEPFPLTEVQEAYWVGRGEAIELGSVSSHVYFDFEIEGLDLERLTAAWRRLIERHDMLRAVVTANGLQRILPEVPPYEIEVTDLSSADEETCEAELAAVRRRMSHQVLPGDRWPLFEIRTVRLPPRGGSGGTSERRPRIRLHVSIDLLIGDAWTFEILEREILTLYRDPAAELPQLELSFRDCVLAEIARRDTEAYRRDLEYWRRRLPTLPPAPELPLARDPAQVSAPRFERRHGRLDRAAWTRLKRRATAAALTPSGVLLAAFAEVLGCWSKSPRFTLNLTLFNRLPMHPQIYDVVGDFTSLTLLEVDAAPDASFEDRARRLQQQLWEDLDHRLVGGVRVIRELARARGESRGAIMPVVFTSVLNQVQGADPVAPGDPDDATAADGETFNITQTPQVWLDHQVSETAGTLYYNWDAVEDLFPAGLLDDMFDAYHNFLERLAEGEEAWQETHRHLVPATQLEQRAAVNATEAPVPAGLLHGPFLEQARQRPERPAVITAGRTVNYGEMLRGSDRLGRELRAAGARRNRLIAVVMDKGWEQVLAVLAVLRSGAAYLPVDPRLPDERRRFLLEHSEVELALTLPELAERLAWPEGVEPITVGEELLAAEIAGTAAPDGDPEDLAYVIFTSGTTGLPKGVMIDHRGALNTIVDVRQRFDIGPDDRVLGVSSLSFDLSVFDIFGTLAAGGALVLPEPRPAPDPAHWAELVARCRVTVWNSVPALLELVVEAAPGLAGIDLSSLRRVLLSGDWIPPALPGQVRALARDAQVISLGGATEASIWSILHPIAEVDPEWASIPYGRPMRNQSFHVLDGNLEPRPVWTPGDLYIGGVGLALGYWRDPEKTAASFLIHPRTGERLYRTGDLGRYLPDGNIEFLGREDFQVKIGGHRIELGEIEAALTRLDEVRSAVVLAPGERSRRRLVACVVLEVRGSRGEEPAGAERAEPIADELAELELKLSEPGIRRDLDDRPVVELGAPPAGEDFLIPFKRRRSHRKFQSRPLDAGDLHRVLGAVSDHRLGVPGGGEPLELVVWVKDGRVRGLAAGAYRYQQDAGRLELLAEAVTVEGTVFGEVNRPIFEEAAFAVFLVGHREVPRERSLTLAGAVGQSLMEAAPFAGVGLCPIGEADFESVRRRFGLDRSYVLAHSLLGGPIAAREVRSPSPPRPAADAPPLPGEGLANLLRWLSQVRSEEDLLPKYRYPSGGSLYPVQTYLRVQPGGVEGVAGGYYYYHPKEHRLLRLAPPSGEADSEGAFSLFLVARLKAIAPVYGDLAEPLCRLEAGYMEQLLRIVAADEGLELRPADEGPGLTELARPLALEPDQILLSRLAGGPSSVTRLADRPPVRTTEAKGISEPPEGISERLRDRLRETLPDYMVPASFVFFDTFPLTVNGKVDRAALDRAALDRAALGRDDPRGQPSKAAAPPTTDLEYTMLEIWREVLGKSEMGIYDNFFTVGGTSVQLIRSFRRLEQVAPRELTIVDLFQHPTVSDLARFLQRESPEESPEPVRERAEQRRAIRRKRRRGRLEHPVGNRQD